MSVFMMFEAVASEEDCWRAVQAKDRSSDGAFVFAVASTGIYCRPSCPARRPLRRNVRFFVGPEAAEAAGFRPCRRCSPEALSREEEAIAQAIATLRAAEEPVPLGVLAAGAGYSPSHFQRMFRRAVGLSPSAYARALRMERTEASLATAERVTDAVYDSGFSAPSRFYEQTGRRLGMAPSVWKNGGEGQVIRWGVAPTSLGPLLIAATDKGVCRVAFGEGADDLAVRFPKARLEAGDGPFSELLERVVSAVEQPGDSRHIPIDVQGTAFQEAVWKALRAIPPGETRSYAQIAAAIGRPRAVRAAGTANGANPAAVLIPCHRVVRSDGSTGGYAWGAEVKKELLRRERNS